MNIPRTNLRRLVIIGGGFAGVALAKKMVHEKVQLTLIDRQKYHTFQPLLYQVSTSSLAADSIAYPLRKIVKRVLKDQTMTPFQYFDKGFMASIGRNKAVVDLGKMRFGGFFAWFVWMFVHMWFLIGFRNRMITIFNWTYKYINFDKASRLIIRPFKNKEVIDHV